MSRSRPRWRGRALAAGLLAVLLAAALWAAVRTAAPSRDAGRALRPITADLVRAGDALILAWEGGGPPYQVSLTGTDGVTLWRSEMLAQPLVRVPPEVQRRMVVGAEHRWQVEAVDRRGRSFRSEPFPLTLRPSDRTGHEETL